MADFTVAAHSLIPAPASEGAVSRELGRVLPSSGHGYLAGEYPGGTTTVEGVPTPATVRVLYRPESGQPGDGAVVAEVESAPDGTWRVDGLNPSLRYDVVGRMEGYNDVIVANVQPAVG